MDVWSNSPRKHHNNKQSEKLKNDNQNLCSFLRRLAAIFYDNLLLGSVFFIATIALMPLIGGEAIESGNLAYNAYLLILAYFYFCWHWVSGGQTLGMRSWHIHVINDSGMKPDWQQSSLRFISSILSICLLGAGFLWALFNKNKLSLHDCLSKTNLIVKKK